MRTSDDLYSRETPSAGQQFGGGGRTGEPSVLRLGNYKLIRKIGQGSMGAVYLAEDINLGREVAVKVLPKTLSADERFVARFRREALALGHLNHPNIVQAFTVGQESGTFYCVMEFCDGEPLDRVLEREKQMPVAWTLNVAAQVAAGLKYAHEKGIVHRDIKPSNILVTHDRVAKILDLGLAKNTDVEAGDSFKSSGGFVVGTAHYISPEQVRGDTEIDGRADIYSFGATLYHLLAGVTPFQSPVQTLVLGKHLHEPLVDPRAHRAELPEGVSNLICRMMEKDRENRFANCGEVLAEIERLKLETERQRSGSTTIPAVGPRKQESRAVIHAPKHGRSRLRALALKRGQGGQSALLGLAIAAVLAAIIAYIWLNDARKHPTPQAVLESRTNLDVPESPDALWIASVQAMGPEQQVDAVMQRLKDLNPGFNGEEKHGVEGGVVAALEFSAAAVRDLSPLRALPKLKRLVCNGETWNWTSDTPIALHDLSPLKGLSLTHFECERTSIQDLSVLKGMPLTVLRISVTRVRSLEPLRGAPLTELGMANTQVRDLSPLIGMPLQTLRIQSSRVQDLAPLQAIRLASINFTPDSEKDCQVVTAHPTLQRINEIPAAEFAMLSRQTVAFGGHRYRIFVEPKTWAAAKALCEERGGHLATLSSKEEADFVVHISQAMGGNSWLGLADAERNGNWRWVTGEPVTYAEWRKGEPSAPNAKRPYTQLDWNRQWVTTNDQATRTFICEWDQEAPPAQ